MVHNLLKVRSSRLLKKITLSFLLMSSSQAFGQLNEVIVADYGDSFPAYFDQQIRNGFLESGDRGAVDAIESLFRAAGDESVSLPNEARVSGMDLQNEFREYASQDQPRNIEVKLHPNRQKALEYTNNRLKNLGINAQLQADYQEGEYDPTKKKVNKALLGLRLFAGAGVATLGTYLATKGSQNLILLLPTISMGVASVVLEIQFASEKINNIFWSKVWNLGGPLTGRLMNVAVNTAYGMICGGMFYWLGYKIAESFGAKFPPEAAPVAFTALLIAKLWDGLKTTIGFGQMQTDISTELHERGTINYEKYYMLETIGSIVNGSARLTKWSGGSVILPEIAMFGLFMTMTLPQLIRTRVSRGLVDSSLRERVWGDRQGTFQTFRGCRTHLSN